MDDRIAASFLYNDINIFLIDNKTEKRDLEGVNELGVAGLELVLEGPPDQVVVGDVRVGQIAMMERPLHKIKANT